MSDPLRVLSWNVRRLRDQRSAVVAILRDAAADVVCLQEGPRVLSRTRLRWLARAAGLRWVAGDLTSVGAAILVAPSLATADPRTVRLPRETSQARGLALATVGGIRFGSVHLGLVADERVMHAGLVRDLLVGGPTVLAGDFNEPPTGAAWGVLRGLFDDPAPSAGVTFSVTNPRHRIDAILTTPDVETVEYGHWRPDPGLLAQASDHMPVLSVVRLR